MNAVIWLNEALKDLQSIGNYIAQENIEGPYALRIHLQNLDKRARSFYR